MTEYTVGVVGCGSVGTKRHIPSWKRDDRANLCAVLDNKKEHVESIADNKGIPFAFTNREAFFEADLDIISVCTPPFTHYDMVTEALESGANVLSEKPLALSTADTEHMIATADETDQTLGVVHNFLFSTSMRKAKRKVESGEVGTVRNVIGLQTSSPRRDLPKWFPGLPGGLFFDESPHLLYLIEYFLGDLTVESVTAETAPDDDQPIKMLNASLRGDGDQMGTLLMLFETPLSEWHFTIVGTEKILVIDIFRDILIELDAEDSHSAKEVLWTSLHAMSQETAGIISSGVRTVNGSLLFGTGELVRRYLDALDEGAPPPITARQGAEIVSVIETILDKIDDH